jgi:hypothetical protein
MAFTPVNPVTVATARASADDANVRSKAADYTVTGPEGTAYNALIAELKAAGVFSPFMEILDKAVSLPNFTRGRA